MLLNNKGLFGTAIMLALIGGGACAAQPQQAGSVAMAGDTPIPLEPPYAVGGVTYTPADPASYDEVGYAGAIEDGSRGGSTATGEAFMPSAIMAAHKTLPLPSYVEVTALDSGRTILVRVNDRGPMRNDQLIALTPGAAAQLGVAGIAAVRVRRVNPPDQERAVLRGHGRAAERLETPAALLKVLREKLGPVRPAASTRMAAAKPRPAAAKPVSAGLPGADFDTPAPKLVAQPAKPAPRPTPAPPTTGGYVVQVGAFSSQARADSLAKRLGAHVASGDGIWRVRLGPYATQQAAQTGVRYAAAKGFENSRIMANDAR